MAMWSFFSLLVLAMGGPLGTAAMMLLVMASVVRCGDKTRKWRIYVGDEYPFRKGGNSAEYNGSIGKLDHCRRWQMALSKFCQTFSRLPLLVYAGSSEQNGDVQYSPGNQGWFWMRDNTSPWKELMPSFASHSTIIWSEHRKLQKPTLGKTLLDDIMNFLGISLMSLSAILPFLWVFQGAMCCFERFTRSIHSWQIYHEKIPIIIASSSGDTTTKKLIE